MVRERMSGLYPDLAAPAPGVADLRGLLAFLVFVQVCDVSALLRAHGFGADVVANGFLLTVDLAEGAVQVPLPVDLIAVDLGKARTAQTRSQIFIYLDSISCGREVRH